jgi:hypothetical protein
MTSRVPLLSSSTLLTRSAAVSFPSLPFLFLPHSSPRYYKLIPPPDCTPKAVSHRLSNIRKGGAPSGTPAPASATSTPTKTATTPRSRAKATPRSNKKSEEEAPLDDEEELLSPSAARGKRNTAKKRSYVESDVEGEDDEEEGYVPMGKRMKTEPVEEASFEKEVDDEV